jgi:two-component SAPR family response regulator
MIINCIIIDDEPLAINVIKNHLLEIDKVNIIDTFNSAIEALNFLKENTVDLIFLDINMQIIFIRIVSKSRYYLYAWKHGCCKRRL